MRNIAVKLPRDLLARLDALSKRRSVRRSTLVRQALQQFLESDGARNSAGSFAEQAAHVAGCFEGPRDLSHAAKHMKDFGR